VGAAVFARSLFPDLTWDPGFMYHLLVGNLIMRGMVERFNFIAIRGLGFGRGQNRLFDVTSLGRECQKDIILAKIMDFETKFQI